MTEAQLIELAMQMRQWQRTYFKDRSQSALANSKRLESEFDKAAAEWKAGQGSLL